MLGTHRALKARTSVAAIIAAAALLALGAAPAGAAGWHWSKPYSIPGLGGQVADISCPTTSLCVAIGQAGGTSNTTDDVYWTTNPTGGKGTWHHAVLENAYQPQIGVQDVLLTSVSCASVGASHSSCAIADMAGNLWQTGNPAGGSWGASDFESETGQPYGYAIDGVSCWSAWCGSIDGAGYGLVTIGAQLRSYENVMHFPVYSNGIVNGDSPGVQSISCNSSGFCATTDETHNVWWTTSAVSDPVTWHGGRVSSGAVETLACPTKTLCVALEARRDLEKYIGIWRDPGGGTWHSFAAPGHDTYLDDVSCVSGAWCAISGDGFMLISKDPSSAKASAWKRIKQPVKAPAEALSCPSKTMCAIAQTNDNTFSIGRS